MCVDGLGYVYVGESYVDLDQCGEPAPFLFVPSVCAFVSCIVMMSGWVLCTRYFSSSILFLMPFMLI